MITLMQFAHRLLPACGYKRRKILARRLCARRVKLFAHKMSVENNPDMDSDSLSMVDVLAEQSRMQEDASAVLGDSDERNCTYPKVRSYLCQCVH